MEAAVAAASGMLDGPVSVSTVAEAAFAIRVVGREEGGVADVGDRDGPAALKAFDS